MKIKTDHNPQYFQHLQFDYKINNSNIKKFYDQTRSNILLFTLVVGVSFFLLTLGQTYMKRNLSVYSHIISHYNTRIHRKQNAFLTTVSENFLPTAYSVPLADITRVPFFIGTQNRFHLLIYTSWSDRASTIG